MVEQYKYQKRIVVFLDILGFGEKLIEFEKEAINSCNGEDFISVNISNLITVFKDAIKYINEIDCNYYLFSDNICLSIDAENDHSLHFETMFAITDLMQHFSNIGHFLRGAIDYGWFVDEKKLALGTPLANAYLLESKSAIYPRVLLSDRYLKYLDELEMNGELSDEAIYYKQYFIRKSCEITYLMPFFNVLKKTNKVEYFKNYQKQIIQNLSANSQKEQVYVKYDWLARTFNNFIDEYISIHLDMDSEIELLPSEIIDIQNLKI